MFDLFWYLYQQRQISDLKSDLVRAKYADKPGDRRLDELERRLDLLALTSAAISGGRGSARMGMYEISAAPEARLS